MSRLIIKASYNRPGTKNISGYANYIATRDGVEIRNQEVIFGTTYADYIATRPGVAKEGEHGLFSFEDSPVCLIDVSNELNSYKGVVWNVIVSLRREDADNTSFNNSEAWRDLITRKADDIGKCFNIPVSSLNCYGAFHESDTHPHMHMIVYSKNPSVYKGYLKESSLQKLKSVFTSDIFEDELSELYKLKSTYKSEIKRLANEVCSDKRVSHELITAMINLSSSLYSISGKKVYAYLPVEVKKQIDDVLRIIGKDPRIAKIYDLYCKQKLHQARMYGNDNYKKVPIECNKDFLSVKNAIIRECLLTSKSYSALHGKHSEKVVKAKSERLMDYVCTIASYKIDEHKNETLRMVIDINEDVDEALGIRR